MVAFEMYLTKLIYFTSSNSTVLASSSNAILDSLSKCNKCERSGLNIIKEFHKVVLGLVEELNELVITKLSHIIGELTGPVTDALNDLGFTFSNFMREFLQSGLTGFRKKVDYEPVLKQLQKFMNTVALISETLLNECELANREVNEAVTVLTLICAYFTIAVQGINTCVQDVLYEQECTISQTIESCSMSLEYVVMEVTQYVDSVTFPYTESIKALLTNLVNITLFLNTTWKQYLGIFEGVAVTVGKIMKNLSKSVFSTTSGDSKGLTNILKGIVPPK